MMMMPALILILVMHSKAMVPFVYDRVMNVCAGFAQRVAIILGVQT